jgi:hypothetical protein
LVYLVLSLSGTAVNELFTNLFSWRARGLRTGIENLLQDANLVERFYAHPLLVSLQERRRWWSRRRWPSSLAAERFSQVLLDVVNVRVPEDREELSIGLPNDHPLRQILQLLKKESAKKGAKFEEEVSRWFDSGMEQVSSWFKGRMQWVSVVVGLGIAAFANADTIQLATDLATDPTLRQAALERAEQVVAEPNVPAGRESLETRQAVEENIEEIKRIGFTLGWNEGLPKNPAGWLSKVVGLVITGFAVSLGAPFWFDTLGRLTPIRSTKKPEGAKDTKSGGGNDA